MADSTTRQLTPKPSALLSDLQLELLDGRGAGDAAVADVWRDAGVWVNAFDQRETGHETAQGANREYDVRFAPKPFPLRRMVAPGCATP